MVTYENSREFVTSLNGGFDPLPTEEILKNFPRRAWSSRPLIGLWPGLIGLLTRLIGRRRLAESLVDLAAQAFSHLIDQFLLRHVPQSFLIDRDAGSTHRALYRER
jgi:hypothetical protein